MNEVVWDVDRCEYEREHGDRCVYDIWQVRTGKEKIRKRRKKKTTQTYKQQIYEVRNLYRAILCISVYIFFLPSSTNKAAAG